MPAPPVPAGRVTLLGAGPGAADLVTVRGWRALQNADVVVADRLVGPDLLAELDARVEVIDVGKAAGRQVMAQDAIGDLLVAKALEGKQVVRLKGGDPLVFGRGGEEALACAAAGVPFEFIPGLSSATAVPTLANVPVTQRGLSQAFTVVSGHVAPGDPASTVDWQGLARLGQTVVVLMGVATLPAICTELLAGGLADKTPVVCIENGGAPHQRVLRTHLGAAAEAAREFALRSPAITVIGKSAAALAEIS